MEYTDNLGSAIRYFELIYLIDSDIKTTRDVHCDTSLIFPASVSVQQLILSPQDGRKLGYGGMQGIPMVATSPGTAIVLCTSQW